VDVEVKPSKRGFAPPRVSMAEKWITPKQNHGLHWIRLTGQGGAIHVHGVDPSRIPLGSERVLAEAKSSVGLLRWEQF
jgi:hypothetical protein